MDKEVEFSMSIPEWCPHENSCIFKVLRQNKICGGHLPEPEAHDDDFNKKRLCIDTRETEHGIFDLQINHTDIYVLISVLNFIDKEQQ